MCRIRGRQWDKSLESFSPCYSQSPLLTDLLLLPPPPSKRDLKMIFNGSIVYGNLKSENSQDYARKTHRNCTFMNSTSVKYKEAKDRLILRA